MNNQIFASARDFSNEYLKRNFKSLDRGFFPSYREFYSVEQLAIQAYYYMTPTSGRQNWSLDKFAMIVYENLRWIFEDYHANKEASY